MTMSAPSQPTLFPETELPSMSSRAGFRAKIYQQREILPASPMEHAPASGRKSFDWLMSYDHNTSLWRTSQISLEALLNYQADGLAEFSGTWPNAGLMRNGRIFQRQQSALIIAESASGLWPTPCKNEPEEQPDHWLDRQAIHAAKGVNLHFKLNVAVKMWPTPTVNGNYNRIGASSTSGDGLSTAVKKAGANGALNPMWVEWLMGFPIGHTELPPSETPSSRKSRS